MEERFPRWGRAVAIVLLIWGIIGIGAFAMQWSVAHDPAKLAALPAKQAEMFASMPGWDWAVYLIAVFSGAAAGLGLVLKRRWAVPAALISLLAVLLQFGFAFWVVNPLYNGRMADFAFPAFIIAIAIFQLWLAARWRTAGLLR